MSTLPARASIEYTCRLLRSYGVDLTAEALRQAKFDSDTVSTIWQNSNCQQQSRKRPCEQY